MASDGGTETFASNVSSRQRPNSPEEENNINSVDTDRERLRNSLRFTAVFYFLCRFIIFSLTERILIIVHSYYILLFVTE